VLFRSQFTTLVYYGEKQLATQQTLSQQAATALTVLATIELNTRHLVQMDANTSVILTTIEDIQRNGLVLKN
jgi:predicted branched-subunit amino acid permease